VKKEKFMDCLSTAFGYGIQQRSSRNESVATIIAWCGYAKLPKPHTKAIYEAYKAGRCEKSARVGKMEDL
jgi:hypothetical protein